MNPDEPQTAPAAAILPEESECWRAVLHRDRAYDGVFVYAVETTGIYCRPSCPARRPRRGNVRFLQVEDAARAGFRACLRCRPQAAGAPADAAVKRAVDYLEAHLDEAVTLKRLGEAVGLSPHHLQRSFKERIGLSPRAYQNARRLERFRQEVRGAGTVSRATYEAGFNSSRGLYESARQGLGMTPARYRRGGRGLQIRYTIVASELGRLLVAATERGVCSVAFGETDETLEEELRREFPQAGLVRDDTGLGERAAAVVQRAEGRDPGAAVPTDLRGTVFQLRVWEALQRIPAGETRSYKQIAVAIGEPGSARAVARACADNRVAVVVPCHRVVRSDGDVAGYRWGSDRKKRLLASEAEERTR